MKPRRRNTHPHLPPHVYPDKSRGKLIHYFWFGTKEYRKARIHADFGTPEWHETLAILMGLPKEHFLKSSVRIEKALGSLERPVRGSYRWGIEKVLKSDTFTSRQWSRGTQDTYAAVLRATYAQRVDSTDITSPLYADVPLLELSTLALQNLIERQVDLGQVPNAKQLRKAFRAVFPLMVAQGLIAEDVSANLPEIRVSRDSVRRLKGDDFEEEEHAHTWTPEEVEKFRQHFPIGTKPRLALELALAFGLARVDLALAGLRNITTREGGRRIFQYRRKKTGVQGTIEVPASTWGVLGAIKVAGTTTLLVNCKGKPYAARILGAQIGKWARSAGLPSECSSHGLRRRFATDWAERGISAPALQTMGAWKHLSEAEKYIRAADKVRLAMGAADLAAR